jgi:four helix bundle protein
MDLALRPGRFQPTMAKVRRRGKADKVRFLNTSESSVEESRYYLILSEDLGYRKTENFWSQSPAK